MYKRKKDQLYYTNRHSCFLLQYHMVLVTKYRKPVLQGKVKESVYNIIKDLCDERGYRILEIMVSRIMYTCYSKQDQTCHLWSLQMWSKRKRRVLQDVTTQRKLGNTIGNRISGRTAILSRLLVQTVVLLYRIT